MMNLKYLKKSVCNHNSKVLIIKKNYVFSQIYTQLTFTDKDIPIVFTNYVLMGYGTGAVFGCPAHDKRDFEFAEKYNFKILNVIEPTPNREQNLPYVDIEEDAKRVNSNFLNGLNPKRAQEKIIEKIKEKKIGGIKTVSKLRDWGISRQRYWANSHYLQRGRKSYSFRKRRTSSFSTRGY